MRFNCDTLEFKAHSEIFQAFFVSIIEPFTFFDRDIATIIGLPVEEYRKILESFGAHINLNEEMIFKDFEDCKKAVNYLEEKYGILLVLLGDKYEIFNEPT